MPIKTRHKYVNGKWTVDVEEEQFETREDRCPCGAVRTMIRWANNKKYFQTRYEGSASVGGLESICMLDADGID